MSCVVCDALGEGLCFLDHETGDDFGCEGANRPRFAASLNLHATLNATEGQRDHG